MSDARVNIVSAYDDFRDRVQNMPSQQAFLSISAELAKRLLSEHEEDCERMEAAAATIEALTELAGSQPDELVTQSVASSEITKRDAQ